MEIFGEKKENVNYLSRPGVYIIFFNSKGEIGVVETPKGLFLPGGGKNKNESDKECLERELIEELGWKIQIGSKIGQNIQYYNSTKKFLKMECYFYFGESYVKVNEPKEKDHILKWLSSDHLIENLHPENQKWAVKEAIKIRKKKDFKIK